MLGLDNTARTTLLILAEMIPDKEFNIKLLKSKGQEELFSKRFSIYSNLHFIYVDTYEE